MIDIVKCEAIAMLHLSGDERELLSVRAEALAEGFAGIDGVGTDEVSPLVSVLELHNVLREDISEKLLPRDEIMANAPEQYDGYFQVPGTIGN